MKMENFEKKLIQMTKPEISQLKHQDMLEQEIMNAKDKFVVNLWWLSIPLYFLGAYMMKSIYLHASFITTIHEFTYKGHPAILWFLILPVLLIIVNFLTIKKLYYLYGSTKASMFIRIIFIHLIILVFSLFILLMYFL